MPSPIFERTANLHEATAQGKRESIDRHIADGANVNEANEEGLTALHIAAKLGRGTIASNLVGSGADVNAKDSQGRVPLHWAALQGLTKQATRRCMWPQK
eukprot:gnl/TRDRNA2_/TRDRNA2_50458_c0_seq1.p2 gnl/TRDRNA2_/TRDRNA2_50458_c0~~gnl/TRDRNA2_/TRDRNA2_50458_c0_seq1.p2  ORF type:complete len:100 (+),score=13.52 gnl/TRDRNA2_/TRDRNA2_50458_c0_seq1:47-346(+)